MIRDLRILTCRQNFLLMKLVLRIAAVMLTMLFSLVYITTQTIAPDYDFEWTTDEVGGDVEVIFDDMAVPHIYAGNELDAMYALGHVHAMERLWQMDLLRRAGAGELSALLGRDLVENDKYLRTLGMRETAERVVETIETTARPEVLAAMNAYLDGVNSFIATQELPFEYRLINAKPEPFTLRDVYCATGFMAYSFAIHLKTEPILDWMKSALDSTYIADLAWGQEGFTHIPTEGNPRDISGLASRVHALDALRPVPQWLGSNAWVLSGDRTASGEVIFCNDAHMAYASPSVWYEAHIVTPELEYYGNHIGGLPFPAIGHTRDHAWGITGRPSTATVTCTVGSGCRWRFIRKSSKLQETIRSNLKCEKPTMVRCWKRISPCGGHLTTTRRIGFTKRFMGFLEGMASNRLRPARSWCTPRASM